MTGKYGVCSYELDSSRPVVASLDVHTESTYVYVVDRNSGEVLLDTRVHGLYKNVVRRLRQLRQAERMVVLYEAGNHGFAPYRRFTEQGFMTRIIAPVSIPKRNRRNKSDRRDAQENLSYYASGKLTFVTPPDLEVEAARDYLRHRCRIVWDMTGVKQRINAMVKRYDVHYDQTKSRWNKKHFQWLRTVELPALARLTLDDRLEHLQRLTEQLVRAEMVLEAFFAAEADLAQLRAYYRMLPGFGQVNSMTMVLEGGDFRRFAHPKPLMVFVGLVPGLWQSAGKSPCLAITKAGNKYLRTALVGAAKLYRSYVFMHSAEKLKSHPPVLAQYIDRMQRRLCSRYRSLIAARKHSNKVKCAIARDLCGFIWELVNVIIPQLEEQPLPQAA